MTFWMPVSDFIGLCIIISEYDLDIPIDELMIKWKYKLEPKRRLRYEVTSFPEYFLIFARYFGYINYSDMDSAYTAIMEIPKQYTIFSDMTLNKWLIPMIKYIGIDSNDSEDVIFTTKSYGKMDSIDLDIHFRRDLCDIEDPELQEGCHFNLQLRHLIRHPDQYPPDKITAYLLSCEYAQKILEIWTEAEIQTKKSY